MDFISRFFSPLFRRRNGCTDEDVPAADANFEAIPIDHGPTSVVVHSADASDPAQQVPIESVTQGGDGGPDGLPVAPNVASCMKCEYYEALMRAEQVKAIGMAFNKVTFNGLQHEGKEPGDPHTKLKRIESDHEPRFGSKEYFEKKINSFFSIKTLHRRLPITNWVTGYTCTDFIGDLIAGITVGFTIIPQSIAFSELANLPPEFGLYSGYIGSFVYILLGTTKEITIGPAAVICILIGGATHGLPVSTVVAFASMLSLLSGIFSMALGCLRMGVVVEFISAPVTAGFVSAAAIVIVVSQLESLLGLEGIHGEELIRLLTGVFQKINETNLQDLTMALVAMFVLIFLQEMKKFNWTRIVSPEKENTLAQIITVVSAARNAVVIIACSFIGYFWNKRGGRISLTQPVTVTGFPSFKWPSFTIPATNGTLDGMLVEYPAKSFADMFHEGGSAMIVIPLICVVEQIAVCKTFAKAKPVDVDQEAISLGASQLIGSFLQAMPVTGSICRSCVNAVSGVRTPMGGAWSGFIVVFAMLFFTPYLQYIPKAALGAIVVCAVVHMIEVKEAQHVWETRRQDCIPLAATFFCCMLLGLEWGFLIGVVVNLTLVLAHAANPCVPVTKFELSSQPYKLVVIMRPDRALLYPGIAKVRYLITKKATSHEDALIVLDCIHLIDVDFTGAKGLGSVASALLQRGQKIIFVNVSEQLEVSLKRFTHNSVETFETAQEWIVTLADLNDRRIIVRSMSMIDSMEQHIMHPHGQMLKGFCLLEPSKCSSDSDSLHRIPAVITDSEFSIKTKMY